jgi:hypothetical protein
MSEARELERKSSAVTLSDMEMFIFPELMYGLVLANIMSPRIWRWRDDPWFAGLERMKPYRRITRLKQYIMDHYIFNLDLDTWGLTAKETELARFRDFISEDTLARSNALFGYEGDKYYFDIDIRTHFGLDKYESNIIPYWKTETVEAMDAFRFKPDYPSGAGECVSLSTLYAAALFLVARIPLKDIYLMATPLHSQNFIDVDDGILTNNRRLVTRNMWFNGTALSAQARRALENERVTIVAHESGCVHTVYGEATMDPSAYDHFAGRLRGYLKTPLTEEILGNFLRHDHDVQKCFQLRWTMHGMDHYVPMERVFAYEHGGPYQITDNTRERLMAEIDMEEFSERPLPSRIILNDLEELIQREVFDMDSPVDVERLRNKFASDCLNADIAMECLRRFCHTSPRLPEAGSKEFVSVRECLGIHVEMGREEIMDRLEDIREKNDTAGMAFFAYRDLNRTDTRPFLLAALTRNPVSVEGTKDEAAADVIRRIEAMPAESIYDETGRLAQPDEVWNFQRGDGVEKAVLLANILRRRAPDDELVLDVSPTDARLKAGSQEHVFPSQKGLKEQRWSLSDV